jgi:hypothetical protein
MTIASTEWPENNYYVGFAKNLDTGKMAIAESEKQFFAMFEAVNMVEKHEKP